MIQLKPITESMTEQELRQALQLNFSLILDAYTKGLNSIVFKGSTGATGIAGSRGASILVTNKNCLDAAQSKSGTQVDITSAYNSGNSATLAAAITTMLTTGDADAVIEAMFNGLSFIKSTADIVEYDICIVDNGLGFQFRYVDETWRVVPLDLELLTQFNINEMVTTIARQAVGEVLPGIQQVPYHTRTLEQGSVTGYLIPGGATTEEGEEKNPTDLPVSTIADTSSYGPFMFATLGIGPNASAGSTIFVGTTEECSKVFRRINDAADAHGQLSAHKLAGMPVNTGDAPGTMPRLLIPTVRNTGAEEPAYGVVFIDQQVNAFADGASGIESLWSICTAGIRFVDGKLQFHVQRNFNNMSGANPDKRGMFVMSRNSFELWCKEGVTIHTDSGDYDFSGGKVKIPMPELVQPSATDGQSLAMKPDGTLVRRPYPDTYSTVPLGLIAMWPSATAPENWALCEGQLISAKLQPDSTKRAILQGLFGSNLPDMRGKFVQGVNASGSSAYDNVAALATAGTNTMKLDIANIPSHRHNMQHTHHYTHTHSMTHVHNLSISIASSGAHTHTVPAQTISSSGSHSHTIPAQTISSTGVHHHCVPADEYAVKGSASEAKKSPFCYWQKAGTSPVMYGGATGDSGSTSYLASTGVYFTSEYNWNNVIDEAQKYANDGKHSHTIPAQTISSTGSHTHTIPAQTISSSGSHTHSFTGTTGSARKSSINADAPITTSQSTNVTSGSQVQNTVVAKTDTGYACGTSAAADNKNNPFDNRPACIGLYYIVRIS